MRTPALFLFAGVIGSLATLPGQTNGISPFTDLLIGAVPISRAQLSLAYLIGTVASAFSMPLVGRLYDKHGSKRMAVTAGFFLGLSVFGLSFADAVVRNAAGVLPAVSQAAAAVTVMSLGFFLVRFFGQGILNLTSRNMVLKWYDDRRGFANAVLAPSVAVGFSYAPRVFDRMISAFGWDGAWRIMGLVLVFGFVVFALFMYADPPAEHRSRKRAANGRFQVPGGINRLLERLLGKPELPRPAVDYTLKQAKRTPAFWIFNSIIFFSSMVGTGFTFHVVGIFSYAGVDRTAALAVFFPATIISVMLQFISSAVSDYLKLRVFAALQMVGILLMMAAVLMLAEGAPYYLLIAGLGLNTAMYGINGVIIWPRFFGLQHLGEISGVGFFWMVAGSAAGPYAYSLSESLAGSYTPAAAVFAAAAVLLLGVSWFAENPNNKQQNPLRH